MGILSIFEPGWRCQKCGRTVPRGGKPNDGPPGSCMGRNGQLHSWIELEQNRKRKKKKSAPKKSFWKPLWAVPFKLLWLLIKLPFKLLFSS